MENPKWVFHPAYPEQVMFSYYEASLVCELIARDYGEPALIRMLQGYKSGQTTDQVFQSVLKTDLATFDRRFDAYLRERFATPLAGLDEFRAKMGEGRALVQRGQLDAAIAPLERAKALFPAYGGDEGPSWYLAQVYEKKGDIRRAAAELRQFVSLNETTFLELDDHAVIPLWA